MWFKKPYQVWLDRSRGGRRSRTAASPPRRLRPCLEQLEDRTLPSSYMAATVSDLIADINAANKAGGTNTITLTAPTSNPYVLIAVDNSSDGANGLPVIANKNILTIVGNGDTIERSTASGTADFRLFDVASGGSLTLENLTVQNGVAFGSGKAAEGGAIFNQGTLVLSVVTVQGNMARGSDGINSHAGNDASGGGVWSSGALTAQSGTLVQNNQAIGGAGASNTKDLLTSVGGNALGGGIFVAAGMATLTAVTVDNNIAQGGQGGSRFRVDGYAYSSGGNAFGGGLGVAAGTVSLSSSTVDNNSVAGGYGQNNLQYAEAFGGGLYVVGGAVTLCSDTVQSNSAIADPFISGGDGRGGGIYIVSGATAYIDPFTVANTINNTDAYGLNSSTANIDGTYILRNC
jgi:hypothetical protein